MKRILFAVLCCMCLWSCFTVHKHYYACVLEDEGKLSYVKKITEKEFSDLNGSFKDNGERIKYDKEGPVHIRIPQLLHDPDNYASNDMSTFPVYGKAHTVEEPISMTGVYNLAIWCTKDATYLVSVESNYYQKTFFQIPSKNYIMDSKTGIKYHIWELAGLPLDKTFFIDGTSGEFFCLVRVYPPLPPTCSAIDIINTPVTDVVKDAPAWKNSHNLYEIPVATLQANQWITSYKETKIIE